jgi:hypothetical protein
MEMQLTIATIGVASALLGSLIGGLSSYLSTKSMRLLEWRLGQIERDVAMRENLYADFLSETNKSLLQSFEKKVESLASLNTLINLESKIRLISPSVSPYATKLTSCVVDHHEVNKEKPNYAEVRDEFIQACRNDLNQIKAKA